MSGQYGRNTGGGGAGRPSQDRYGQSNAKLQEAQRKVDDVKGFMQQNIALSLDRGAKLEVMEEKAEDLENQSKKFQTHAVAVKRHFCWQYIKLTIIIFLIVAAIATIIGVSIYKSKN